MDVVNLEDELGKLSERGSPRILGVLLPAGTVDPGDAGGTRTAAPEWT